MLRLVGRSAANRRANSVLAMTPAGVDDAVPAVEAHYAALGRRPIAAVLPDSAEEEAFRSRGWVLESGELDSLFQLASVAMARRTLRERPAYAVRLEEDGDQLVATVGADAGGLASLAGDWVGLRALEVAPSRRRRGLGLAVVGALLDWGAERGATTAYLQVLADNEPALGLYEPTRLLHPPHLPLPRSLTLPRPNVCCVLHAPDPENGAKCSKRSS